MNKQSVDNKCTAIIKTFERPDKVTKLLASIRRFYPSLPVVIIDDSKVAIDKKWDRLTEYYHVAYDIGLSDGRNRAVSYVKTPFTLLLDDDFIFTKDTTIELLLAILEDNHFDLVGGEVIDHGKYPSFFRGNLYIKANKLWLQYKAGSHDEYSRYDFVLNFFLARTEVLQVSPWDPDLKIREHEDFFWRLKKHDIKITYTNKVSLHHFPDVSKDTKNCVYKKMRIDRVAFFHRLACEKVGVDDFIVDYSIYDGRLRIFKLYSRLSSWVQIHKNDSFIANLFWHVWRGVRPIVKTIYWKLSKLTK